MYIQIRGLLICIQQPKQEIPIPRKSDNILHNFGYYKEEEYKMKGLNIEEDQIDLIGKSLEIGSHAKDILLEYTF